MALGPCTPQSSWWGYRVLRAGACQGPVLGVPQMPPAGGSSALPGNLAKEVELGRWKAACLRSLTSGGVLSRHSSPRAQEIPRSLPLHVSVNECELTSGITITHGLSCDRLVFHVASGFVFF